MGAESNRLPVRGGGRKREGGGGGEEAAAAGQGACCLLAAVKQQLGGLEGEGSRGRLVCFPVFFLCFSKARGCC